MEKSTQIFTIIKFVCLSVVLIDSASRTDKNYYPQVFLEECKYVIKENIYILLIIWWFLLILMNKILMKKLNWWKFRWKKYSDYEENSDEEILKKIKTEKNYDEEN